MEGPRATKPEEVQSVIDLVNLVFRTGNGLKPTMGMEFPLLLCKENRDNMRIIVEDGYPVSDVNYYSSTISVEGANIRTASVGAVCTHPDYRGRNYATTILDDIEAKMQREGVEVMLVSGSRGLYLRRGCVKVGGFYKAILKPPSEAIFSNREMEGITLSEINENNLAEAVHFYHQETVRYHRSYHEFVQFHKGATTPWGNRFFKSYLIRVRGNAAAYIVVKLSKDSNIVEVKEFAGDRSLVIKGIFKLLNDSGLAECSLISSKNDVLNILLEGLGIPLQHQDQQGTLKILNYPSLMNSLKPFMRQYLQDNLLDAVRFEELDGKYIIAAGDEALEIDNMNVLGQLIFGQREQDPLIDVLFKNELEDKPKLQQFIRAVFPIPFPWTGNMNYI